jgi:hypothetical protein
MEDQKMKDVSNAETKPSIPKQYKVNEETANQFFENWAYGMDIDIDTSKMDEDDATGFNNSKTKVIKAIMRGDLVFNDNDEAVYTPIRKNSKKCGEAITFHERTGASLLAQDGKKKNSEVKKTFAVMAEMCKCHPSDFANMAGVDLGVCMALFVLLMD